ncbi:MAG: hypothetical protein HY917_01680, partial [Candidatus Diapherotrites archaeon]|nr:hypothetical protein [Candidatus Diapherotrites archaeon]
NLSWEKCPNLKQQSARNFCLRFHSFCVKEKCPAKYRRPVSDDGPSLYEKVKRLDV